MVYKEADYIEEQKRLALQIDNVCRIEICDIHAVAGIDTAYWKKGEQEYGVCCIVIIDMESKNILEEKYYSGKIEVPYIPGCLAFREVPMILKTVECLQTEPDLYIFDGNGYLHPRHMGLATHAGILLQKPSIGIAKSYYKVHNVLYPEVEDKAFAYQDIVVQGEVYGRVLRTQQHVKPIFLSTGNQIDLDTSMEIVKMLVSTDSHIPIPTRLADIMTRKIRKEIKNL